eukprot:2902233-Amphidinium_carterae.1
MRCLVTLPLRAPARAMRVGWLLQCEDTLACTQILTSHWLSCRMFSICAHWRLGARRLPGAFMYT